MYMYYITYGKEVDIFSINLLTIHYTLYRIAILKHRECMKAPFASQGKLQVTPFLIKRGRNPTSQNCACAVDSATNFKCCICDPQWNSRKHRGSCSHLSARYLNTFRLLQKKSVSRRSPTYRITRGTQLTGQLGRLSNGGISTISNRTNPSANALYWWQRIKKHCVTGCASYYNGARPNFCSH